MIKRGSSVVFEPASVSFGTPVTYSIITPPLYGTATLGPVAGQFSYTGSPVLKHQQDAFQVQIDCECGTATAWCEVQVIRGKAFGEGTKLVTVIDTNTITTADGVKIKDLTEALVEKASVDCGVPLDYYILPVQQSRVLAYQKMLVDNGASASLDPLPAWVELQKLPTSWSGGAAVDLSDVQILSFSNNTDGDYHANSLVSGFVGPPVQPAGDYNDDYDDLIASITGVANTAWSEETWGGEVTPQFAGGLRQLNLPVTTGTVGVDSAAILMYYASLYGTLVPENLYIKNTGATDVSNFLKDPPAVMNPYTGTITSAGNTVEGLMLVADLEWFAQLYRTSGADPFDYDPVTNPDFLQEVWDATIGTDCPPEPEPPAEDYYAMTLCEGGDPINVGPQAGISGGDVVTYEGNCYSITETDEEAETVELVPFTDGDCECCLSAPAHWIVTRCDSEEISLQIQDRCTELAPGYTIKFEQDGIMRCWTVADEVDEGEIVEWTLFEGECPECIESLG